MALVVIKRNFAPPSLRRTRWFLLLSQLTTTEGQDVSFKTITVRKHFVVRAGDRKKTLRIGLLLAGKVNRNVLLYRKLQPNPQQFYPIFTPWRRRVKALGQIVAPVIAVGGGGSGMDLQHYLGLTLMKLGGVRF